MHTDNRQLSDAPLGCASLRESESSRCGSTHLSGLIPGVALPALLHGRSVLRRPVLPGGLCCRRNHCCGLCEVRKECCPTRIRLLPPGPAGLASLESLSVPSAPRICAAGPRCPFGLCAACPAQPGPTRFGSSADPPGLSARFRTLHPRLSRLRYGRIRSVSGDLTAGEISATGGHQLFAPFPRLTAHNRWPKRGQLRCFCMLPKSFLVSCWADSGAPVAAKQKSLWLNQKLLAVKMDSDEIRG